MKFEKLFRNPHFSDNFLNDWLTNYQQLLSSDKINKSRVNLVDFNYFKIISDDGSGFNKHDLSKYFLTNLVKNGGASSWYNVSGYNQYILINQKTKFIIKQNDKIIKTIEIEGDLKNETIRANFLSEVNAYYLLTEGENLSFYFLSDFSDLIETFISNSKGIVGIEKELHNFLCKDKEGNIWGFDEEYGKNDKNAEIPFSSISPESCLKYFKHLLNYQATKSLDELVKALRVTHEIQ